MAFEDLREFLATLEKEGELCRVELEVDSRHEIGAICRKVVNKGGPALFFEKVKGFEFPLVCNLWGTRKRYFIGLEISEEGLREEWNKRIERGGIESKVVSDGPCKENKMIGDDVDLLRFPTPIWNEKDGGPYITQPICISRDPETGIMNVGMYRVMVHDRRTTGILLTPYRHMAYHREKARKKGKALPVAIVLGTDPVVCQISQAPYPFGVDELAMAGALRGRNVELVKCETIDLEVPATAEIVIEGEIPIDKTMMEGPYGEFTGYYGAKSERPIVEVKAITYRDDAIYHGLYNGRPPTEEVILRCIITEIEMMRQCALSGVKRLVLSEAGCGIFNVVVQIEKPYDGYAMIVASNLLGQPLGWGIKNVIVVDEDIDPTSWQDIEWAMATRFQPLEDLNILKNVTGVFLDPTLRPGSREGRMCMTSKMVMDLTKPVNDIYGPFAEVCVPKQEAMDMVEKRWKDYGIPL